MKRFRQTPATVLACLVFLCAACATTLPSQRPADLTIKMTRGGGQTETGKPLGDELLLSRSDTSHYKVDYQDAGSLSVALDVSDSDLDALYEVLRESGFDHLSNGEHTHGTGTWVTVTWEQYVYTAHVNGDASTPSRTKKNWDKVVSALKSFKKQEIEGKDIEIPVIFDSTPFGAALPIQKETE